MKVISLIGWVVIIIELFLCFNFNGYVKFEEYFLFEVVDGVIFLLFMLEIRKVDDDFFELFGVLSVFGGFLDDWLKNIYVWLVLFFVNVWFLCLVFIKYDSILLFFFMLFRIDKKVIWNKLFVGIIKVFYVKRVLLEIFLLFEIDVDLGILVVCERLMLGR